MDINAILNEVDKLFDENRAKDAEKLMLESLNEAVSTKNTDARLQLLNELIGYYRQTGEINELIQTVEAAVMVCTNEMGLEGSIPYATTMLNAATGYRAAGRTDESEKCYKVTEEIYSRLLPENDMLWAGLYNNRSLLCQEKGDYEGAGTYLQKALTIAKANDAEFETAVTYANLANTYVMAGKYQKAGENAKAAIERFDAMKLHDAHYCAALSALGMCRYSEHKYDEAADFFRKAMDIIEGSFGRDNMQYERLKANLDECEKKIDEGDVKMSGLKLSKKYYETYGIKMIEEKFPEYADRIAVGLVGSGSDCLGYDDAISEDHDWGPDFCLWLTDETYSEIGDELKAAYDELPAEFMGYSRTWSSRGAGRRGVMTVSGFYKKYLNSETYDGIDWRNVEDYALAATVNGEVFRDDEGIFTEFRDKLKKGYPEEIQFLKLAEDAAKVSQNGQYNYFRMMKRGDKLTADMMMGECIKNAMKLQHHICNVYPPHDKWLHRSLLSLPEGDRLDALLSGLAESAKNADTKNESSIDRVREATEKLGAFFAGEMYNACFISDIDTYLDMHTDELVEKAVYSRLSDSELVDKIAETEFEAFDKVKNEGGRASCQNDWPTFSVMRKSQYMTWNRTMLIQYLYDFNREFKKGHNLITEKYGRMMESTAPDRYEEIKDNFPEISDEKKAVIEQIVAIQMRMMESFAEIHPHVARNARTLHTYEDNMADTSYETYLRGEISTYSDKMLQLYGAYVVHCSANNINIAAQTIENSAKLYGYRDIEEFEKKAF